VCYCVLPVHLRRWCARGLAMLCVVDTESSPAGRAYTRHTHTNAHTTPPIRGSIDEGYRRRAKTRAHLARATRSGPSARRAAILADRPFPTPVAPCHPTHQLATIHQAHEKHLTTRPVANHYRIYMLPISPFPFNIIPLSRQFTDFCHILVYFVRTSWITMFRL